MGGRGGRIWRSRVNRLLISVVLPLLILASGWRVFHQFRAAQIANDRPTLDGLLEAVRLDPKEPRYHFQLGVAHRDIPELRDIDQARSRLETAVALNPHNWRYRRELAQLYELSGQISEAEVALLKAVELSPRRGNYRWRLANFYLRNRSMEKAVPQLELALAANSRLAEPVLGLLMGAGSSYQQINRVWPRDRESRLRLLRLLCRQPWVDEIPERSIGSQGFRHQLWDQLLDDTEPLLPADGQVYVERLFEEQRFGEARERWSELAVDNGWSDTRFEKGQNLIWNGDFEWPLTGVGLDWRVRDADGYAVKVAEGEGSGGSDALRLTFDGSQNLKSLEVLQRVIVDPGQGYRLSVRARTEDLSTDQGVFVVVQDGLSRRQLVALEPFRGSMPWTRHSSGFVARSPWILVLLRRNSSLRFDNQIDGVLWLDSVNLEPVSS